MVALAAGVMAVRFPNGRRPHRPGGWAYLVGWLVLAWLLVGAPFLVLPPVIRRLRAPFPSS